MIQINLSNFDILIYQLLDTFNYVLYENFRLTHKDLLNINNYSLDLFSNIVYFDVFTYTKKWDSMYTTFVMDCLYHSVLHDNYYSSLKYTKAVNLTISLPLFKYIFSKLIYFLFLVYLVFFLINKLEFQSKYFSTLGINFLRKITDLSEEEYGAFDDFQYLIIILVVIFGSYCWFLFTSYFISLNSNSWLILGIFLLLIVIMAIPSKLLYDYGLFFAVYIKGSSNSSILTIESIFDIISVIIMFTRIIIQNIRIVLIFAAYLELFEWASTSYDLNLFISLFSSNSDFESLFNASNWTDFLFYFITIAKTLLVYFYSLMHLIIASFMQLGIYLMVCFWLFFFLYTTFNKTILDNYFSNIRND